MITVSAVAKLMPRPPALVDNKNANDLLLGSAWGGEKWQWGVVCEACIYGSRRMSGC